MNTITLEDVAGNFGCAATEFSERFISFYNSVDMTYESIDGTEYDNLLLEMLKKIESDSQVIGAPERTGVWLAGWQENLDDFRSLKSREALVPRFIRPNKVIRYKKSFIKPSNPYFERDFARLVQIYMYDNFIKGEEVSNVYEFGCGSSFNLMSLYDLTQEDDLQVTFYGSDFVPSSANLVNELATHFDAPLHGSVFNMIEPDYSYEIQDNSCVFTFGTIEQLDSKFKNYVNFLLHKKPQICFHIEPTVENYTEDTLFDYLQIKFHTKRGYTQGLVPYLEELANDKKIEIVKKQRLNFGSQYMEGYHLIAWRPL